MRTTVTLETDVEILLREAMRERGASFKSVLNNALRAGLAGQQRQSRTPFCQPVHHLGRPRIDLDKALALAAASEDAEILRKQAVGK